MWSPTTGKLISKDQTEETWTVTSKSRFRSRSKSRANHTPVPMAGNNETTKLQKMTERMQAKMEESENKVR